MTDYSDLLFRLDFGDDAIIALQIRIRKLEAALKPFADKATACEQRYSDFIPEDDRTFAFTLGDLRQVRKVLGEKE